MKQYRNIAKERLLAGEMTFGFQIRVFKDPEIARAISSSGFHFAFIDLEHTALDVSDASRLAISFLESGVTPIARIPEGDYWSAGRLIDGGVQGIVVPHVDTACRYGQSCARGCGAVQVSTHRKPLAR